MGFIWIRVMQRLHHSFSDSLTGKNDLNSKSTIRLETECESMARRASRWSMLHTSQNWRLVDRGDKWQVKFVLTGVFGFLCFNEGQRQPVRAFKKTYTYITFAARTALTFISMSRKAIRTFSELSWRLYLSVGKSFSRSGWLRALSRTIVRHWRRRVITQTTSH